MKNFNETNKSDSIGQPRSIILGKYNKNVTLNCGFWQEWSVSELVQARAAMRTSEQKVKAAAYLFNASEVTSRSSCKNTRLIQSLFYRFRLAGWNDRGKCNENVILSRSEGSHNLEILRSLRFLRMTWDKWVNIFSLSKGKGIKNHFLTSLPANLLTSKPAFTLAEVLITLGIIGVVAAITIPGLINNYKAQRLHSKFIIGVVAAITIPGLINNYKAQRLHSKFLKTYSVLQQVFKQMEADDVSLDPNSYPYSQPFYKTFMKYLTNITNCGRLDGYGDVDIRTAPCYYTRAYKYRDYSGKSTIEEGFLDDGQIVLSDGTIIFFENGPTNGVWLSTDLNGLDVPNRWGVDLFTFQFIDGELRTMGSPGTTYTDMNNYCNINVSHNLNGIACAHKAKSNSDYFKQAVKLK